MCEDFLKNLLNNLESERFEKETKKKRERESNGYFKGN